MIKRVINAVFFFILGIIFTTSMFFRPYDIRDYKLGERVHYSTKNGEFKFTCIPSKGKDYESLEKRFTHFKEENPEYAELTIFRITHKNYFNLNKWCSYKYRPEWQYEHIIWGY